jgi:hypothetical protein
MRLFAPLLFLVVAGLVELAAALWIPGRATSLEEFERARDAVARIAKPGDLIVVAPRWAEPLARAAFGDELMPIAHLARADDSSFARAIEVRLPGAPASPVELWPAIQAVAAGELLLSVRENPAPLRPVFRFLENLERASVFLERRGRRDACPWTERGAPNAGGLHGAVAFPRRRFQCPGGAELFVGITLIDDQDYRPRRCIWAHPPHRGALVIRFDDVPLGERVTGYAGLSYFLFRDGGGAPVGLELRVGARKVGRYQHRDELGWAAFAFATPGKVGRRGDVEFRVTSPDARQRHFCFYADTR